MLQVDVEINSVHVNPISHPILIYFFSSVRLSIKKALQFKFISLNLQHTIRSFSGNQCCKSYGIEPSVIADFNSLADQSKQKNIDLSKVQALFFPLMILLIGVSNLMVIYIGGKQYIDGEIQIGVVAEFIIYVNMLTWPVAVVGW